MWACLQQSRELGVPVGSVPAFGVHKSTDDVPQSTQGQIDLGGFLQAVPSCPCLALPLAAGQVYQIQLPHSNVPTALQADMPRPMMIVIIVYRYVGQCQVPNRCVLT